MPPTSKSRYFFALAVVNADGKQELTETEPFRYKPLPDNRIHRVVQGDTLWGLAAKYFKGLPEAALRWDVIADFQPEPIIDPTLRLTIGRELVIPSLNTVQTLVKSPKRRRET